MSESSKSVVINNLLFYAIQQKLAYNSRCRSGCELYKNSIRLLRNKLVTKLDINISLELASHWCRWLR